MFANNMYTYIVYCIWWGVHFIFFITSTTITNIQDAWTQPKGDDNSQTKDEKNKSQTPEKKIYAG